jgi:hypothetical protein
MKKTIAALTIALLLIPTTATAVAKQPVDDKRLLWNQRILLRIEGGQCEANGLTAPSHNLFIVPTLVKINKKWVPTENSEVRILIDEGGVACD